MGGIQPIIYTKMDVSLCLLLSQNRLKFKMFPIKKKNYHLHLGQVQLWTQPASFSSFKHLVSSENMIDFLF